MTMNEITERELGKIHGVDLAGGNWPVTLAEKYLVSAMATAAAEYRERTAKATKDQKIALPHLLDRTNVKVSSQQKRLWTFVCDGVSGTKIYLVRPGLYVVAK
jgi:hypothetical protein